MCEHWAWRFDAVGCAEGVGMLDGGRFAVGAADGGVGAGAAGQVAALCALFQIDAGNIYFIYEYIKYINIKIFCVETYSKLMRLVFVYISI